MQIERDGGGGGGEEGKNLFRGKGEIWVNLKDFFKKKYRYFIDELVN